MQYMCSPSHLLVEGLLERSEQYPERKYKEGTFLKHLVWVVFSRMGVFTSQPQLVVSAGEGVDQSKI